MRRVLDDPHGIAAASPLTAARRRRATPAPPPSASLRVVSAAADPQLTASIAFTSARGDYAWELRDRDTNALVSSGTGTWTAGQPIALNGFELSLNGVPAQRRHLRRRPDRRQPAANNGNALAFAALRDEALVGRALDASGIPPAARRSPTPTRARSADIGVRVQSARTAAEHLAARGHRRGERAREQGRRQPRRRGRAADPVPAELPGRGEDPAGRAVRVRHAAADRSR